MTMLTFFFTILILLFLFTGFLYLIIKNIFDID